MGPHADKNMDMIRDAVYLKHFVFIGLKNACQILM